MSEAEPRFAHMFEETFVDQRRRQLSQVNLIAESAATGLTLGTPLATAVLLAAMYMAYVLSVMSQLGKTTHTEPAAPFELGTRQLADIQWGSAVLVTCAYCFLVFIGVRWMERRSPVRSVIFELMAVYNCMQVLMNVYEIAAILYDMTSSDFRLDTLPKNVAEPLIWLQYHCRQLELLDSFFMILRKKFSDVSLFHMYYRVLNMWGWFFGFHYACVGPTLVPALVTSIAQTLQYMSFSMALFGVRKLPIFRKAPIAELQIASSVICVLHTLFMAVTGRLPIGLAMLHVFVLLNGVVLYTDFHFRETHPLRDAVKPGMPAERVTFSFDSAGWLYVYQFGVAAFLQEHLMPAPGSTPDPSHYPDGLGFSGSSAGALTALLLASGTSVPDVFEHVLAQYKICRRQPWKMPVCAEEALRQYQFPGAYKVIAGRLRILITRALFRPPFIMGEVVDEFPDNETAIQLLMASCHIPGICGVLPKNIGGKYYYDGMMWSSLFVPWRGAKEDHIVKVSGIGGVMSDIRPPFIPPWWCILPPPVRVLRGLYWQGYMDALMWFRAPPRAQLEGICGSRRERSDSSASLRRQPSNVATERKWQAAKALLKQAPPKLAKALAVSDPSGETVRTLLKDFYDARSWTLHAAALAFCLLLLPLGAVMLFNIVIAACERARQWQRALRLFRQMGLRGAPPNVVSFTTMMTALTRGTKWDLSLRLMEEARDSPEQLNTFMFSSAISACEKGNLWTLAVQLLEDAEATEAGGAGGRGSGGSRAGPSDACLNATISCVAKALEWQSALDLAASFPSRQLHPNSVTYNASIGASGAGRHWTLASHLFAEMQSRQVQSNNMILGTLASTLGESSHWPRALEHLKAFEADGGVADHITLSAILAGCARGSSWEAAMALLVGMRARQLDLHVISCNAAMTACQRAQQWHRALFLFEDMASRHLEPGSQTSNVAIQACLSGSLWEFAVHLLEQLEEPDEFAFTGATLAVVAATVGGARRSQALALYREACDSAVACHLHSVEAGVIDLHDLRVEQAKLAVEATLLERLTNACLGRERLADLVIVVGLGNRSTGGQPVVGPAVVELLREELQIPVSPLPKSPGRLVVKAAALEQWLNES
ncbi:PPR10 [Symbiodinium natans]|uniref:PPR10 protein n=1 Tax=Symbiodinium natans TaxID=878477 RepID=A0A812TPS0_9DINO|nr:PPR10 [Symbiodinium natans]